MVRVHLVIIGDAVVDVSGFAALMTDAAARVAYDDLRAAFVRYTRSEVAERLRQLAADVREGRYPAGRPYRHVNGFTKVVVAEHLCGARLTLHYWPADPAAPDDFSRPHDHRFPFSSILLGGSQHFVELAESDDPEAQQWRRFEYRPYLRGRVAAVAGTGEIGLMPLRTVDRAPFDGHYAISSTVVHQAITSRKSACMTLVLRGPRERRTSQVYYRQGEPAPRGGIQLGHRLAHDEVVRQLDHAASLVSTM
jgi:hypothetical protein